MNLCVKPFDRSKEENPVLSEYVMVCALIVLRFRMATLGEKIR